MNARQAALDILVRVESSGGYANLALDETLRRYRLSDEDRHLVTAMVNGTIRYRIRLDWVLSQFLKKKLDRLPARVAALLRLSAYQLLLMEKIPEYAAINEAVNLTYRLGFSSLAGMVNAVLREIERSTSIAYPDPEQDLVGYLSVYYSHPAWMVERWLSRWGREYTERLLSFNNSNPPVTLRANTLKVDRERLIMALDAEGIKGVAGNLTPWAVVLAEAARPLRELPSYQEGLFYVQDEGSMLAAAAVAPQRGWTVLDACAGVGGKTTLLAQLMEDQGVIKAFDLYPRKVSLLGENCRRLGITCVQARAADIMEIDEAGVDAVLLDAPCSGTGVLRRRADARYRRQPADIEELAAVQKKMLARCAAQVGRDGVLVYSTCSLEPEENEDVVKSFLASHREFQLESLEQAWPWLRGTDMTAAGTCLIDPVRYNSDGMFIARMRRKTA